MSINRYKEIEYEETDYPETAEILEEIENISKKIKGDLVLKGLL